MRSTQLLENKEYNSSQQGVPARKLKVNKRIYCNNKKYIQFKTDSVNTKCDQHNSRLKINNVMIYQQVSLYLTRKLATTAGFELGAQQ